MEILGEMILKENLTSIMAKVVWIIFGIIMISFYLWGVSDSFSGSQAIFSGLFLLYFLWAIILVYPKWEVYYYSGSIKLTKSYLVKPVSIETDNIKAIYIVEFNPKHDFRYFGKLGTGKFRHVIRWPQGLWPGFADSKKGVFVEMKKGMHYIIGSRDPEKVIDIIKAFPSGGAKLWSVAQQITSPEPPYLPFLLPSELTGRNNNIRG
jgi:hypothetical protein